MLRSAIYQAAMIAVIDAEMNAGLKLEVIAQLMQDKRVALFTEEQTAKEAAENA